MIGKITKGSSFGGCVRYVLKEDKDKLLEAVNVGFCKEEIAQNLELQTLLNEKVKNTVGHISLNFSVEDSVRLKTDDALMLQVAHDYMERMEIKNTQFIIARHTDREHPHCHIVFNRVDNDGRTISDKNDRYRNEKVCKMLTAKYRLHFAEGKDHIKTDRLRPYEKVRHEIYTALKKELPQANSWRELQEALREEYGIDTRYKLNSQSKQVEGVKFELDGFSISGSKVSREFSYERIGFVLECNAILDKAFVQQEPSEKMESRVSQYENTSSFGLGLDLLGGSNNYNEADEEALKAELRKKKVKKRGFRM